MDKFDPIPEVREWKRRAGEQLHGKSYSEIKNILREAREQFEAEGLKLSRPEDEKDPVPTAK